ncbi:PHB depolymerase family esterase [Candidatus Cyanaurora vandensis]|uniref:extracellular catalytic domain type 1 short-chain-length polyhydroxyalkanoate depolymerase n=1 Tax=Candidatus Cyanaurora vandensis TaxID=2714958 RepID=UPI00257A75AD|nr:PHB depolymerase family esterase [Candidatus Cyanaurora vandensis]
MWRILFGLVCLGLLRPVLAQSAPGNYDQTLRVGGVNRTYSLHLPPAYNGKRALPLVILLHGRKGNGQVVARYTQMSAQADRAGFIVAYPDALGQPPAWNAGFNSGKGNGDDERFLSSLLARLQANLRVDSQRLYIGGHSSGAMMTYRMGAVLSDQLAAIGVVAGAVGGGRPRRGQTTTIPNPAQPLSVVAFHGQEDNVVPYNGGRGFLSVADAMTFWTRATGCPSRPRENQRGDVRQTRYADCQRGTEVVFYTLRDGNHKWPGSTADPNDQRQPASQDLNATQVMWEFFARHPRSSR